MSKYTTEGTNAPKLQNNGVVELPDHIAAALIQTFISSERILDSGRVDKETREEMTYCRNVISKWLDE